DPTCDPSDPNCTAPVAFMRGNHWNAWGQVFSGKIPYGQVSIVLELPISSDARNNEAQKEQLAYRHLEAELDQLRTKAKMEVREAFLQLKSSSNRLKAVKERLSLVMQNLEAAKKKFESGIFGTYDVIRVQMDLESAEIAFAAAETGHVVAQASLEATIGDLPRFLRIAIK
ncbi:MAG: TolC family protein, partial [Pseudomonadota bacterium]